MKSTRVFASLFALSLLLTGALAQAAQVSGTVTDKTTGKPAAGDAVVLVEPMAGMAEVGRASTDSKGHYTLDVPTNAPTLIRVTHQGAEYFISTPQGSAPADIAVYDVAAKVQGVSIQADVIEAEAAGNGQLSIDERIFVSNVSSPPTTQWSKKSFSIVLPADATIGEVNAQRPDGLPTGIKLDPDGPKGHYSIDWPIQPDDGDKNTMFQVLYTLPYSGGKYTFKSVELLPADNLAVLLPVNMKFAAGSGATFNPKQLDPGVNTYLARQVAANKPVEFTVSGTGSIPQQAQGGAQGGDQQAATPSGPGGGIGAPIGTPDPLSKYKWWILGGLGLLLIAAAAFLLRRPEGAAVTAGGAVAAVPASAPFTPPGAHAYAGPAAKSATLLDALKEELFALESDKISGKVTNEEYAQQKAALETVLKRALKRS